MEIQNIFKLIGEADVSFAKFLYLKKMEIDFPDKNQEIFATYKDFVRILLKLFSEDFGFLRFLEQKFFKSKAYCTFSHESSLLYDQLIKDYPQVYLLDYDFLCSKDLSLDEMLNKLKISWCECFVKEKFQELHNEFDLLAKKYNFGYGNVPVLYEEDVNQYQNFIKKLRVQSYLWGNYEMRFGYNERFKEAYKKLIDGKDLKPKKNIFELWRENGENLPFKVRLDSWSDSLGHYALIEDVKVKKWPYGDAFGQYFFYKKPGRKGEIDNSGCYRWKIVD